MNNTIGQLDLLDVYKTNHQIIAEYTFFSSANGIFSKTDYHKTSLNKLKKIKIIQSIFSDHNGIKLEISSRTKTGKSTDTWKLNTTLFIYLFIWLCWISVAACVWDLRCCMWGLFICGMWTLSCDMWALVPWPRIEPKPLALELRFSATGPPGKSQKAHS